MKINKVLYIPLLLLIWLVPACTDLEEETFDVLPADTYFQDKNSVIAALVRVYEHGHWVGWDGARWVLQELTADNFVWTQKGKHGYDDGQWIRLHEHDWNADDGNIYGGWVGPFQGIGQTNTYMKDFGAQDYSKLGMSETEKAQHMAELKTLRAWFYLFLIDFFRNVPIVEDNVTVKGQSPPQEVFAFIEKDLTEALPNLPQNGRVGRWDQAGAAALMVRLYMNAEKWIGTPRYTDAGRIAQEIIDGKYGSYSIDPDYRGPFRSGVAGYRSPENIFEFPHAKEYLEPGYLWNAFMHYQARYSLDNNYGGWNGIHLTPSRDLEGNLYNYELGMPYETFSDDDKRKQPFVTTGKGAEYEGFFLIGPQYEFNSAQGFGYTDKPVNGTEEYNGKPLVYVDQVGRFSEGLETAKAKGSKVNAGEENSGVRFIKFPWLPLSQNLFMFNSFPEVRLAEIYYSLAEVKYRAGDKAGAAVLLDAVRKRNFPEEAWPMHSYVNNIDQLTDDEFVDELSREFLGERHRRTDLVRWNRFGDAWWDKPQDAADKSVFPIPNRALNANPLLKPNG
jgi:hypothetical protein